MSHLRAPAARTDRREGGRHGRPGGRTVPPLPETHIRTQLLRIAVLPALAVSLCAGAAVLFTVRSTAAHPSPVLWAVLAGSGGVALAGLATAAIAADRTARALRDRVNALRRSSARGQAELRGLVESLRRGDPPPARRTPARPADGDDFDLLAAELTRAQDAAVGAVVQAAQLSGHARSEHKVEVFVNLARRLQSLVHREISILDDLENSIEDPDLLKGLFSVDHLATRIRRHAENLAVLGGAVSRRQWSSPVSMMEVLRSATAEVEHYSRVKLVPPIDGTLRGHAVADVVHLLAELVENASVFSAPHTQVLIRVNGVTSGLAVEVEDRGLGMPVAEQNTMNALLADPDKVDVASLLQDGRIGLFVVSQLARRHGVAVRLQTNIYGGIQAVVVLPKGLLGAEEADAVPAVHPHATAPAALQDVRDTGAGPHAAPAARDPRAFRAAAPVDARGRRQGGPAAVRPPLPGAPGDVRIPLPGASADVPGTLPGTPGGAIARQPGGPDDDVRARPAPPVPLQPLPGQDTAPPRPGGAGLAPLPVRDSRADRPNPSEARPGVRAEDRAAADSHAGVLPTPLNGVVRGTIERPLLPRRRAQEHIAPQLRGGPGTRQDADRHVDHDPGLMAAFQRGIGLAEAQAALDTITEHDLGPGRDGSGPAG
ncbi:ATP-binding protein [Streptomyces sp. NPDC002004]